MKEFFGHLAISRIFWVICFILTIWLMAHNGVWTDHTPVNLPTPTKITE